MRNIDRVDGMKLIAGVAAVWMLAAGPGFAQEPPSGVSHPSAAPITTTDSGDAAVPVTKAKPSAAIPAPAAQTVYGPYVPYQAPGKAVVESPAAFDPDANLVTEASAGRADRRLLSDPPSAKNDPDAGIVTHVPSVAGEVPDGTLVKVKLLEDLSTMTTKPGTKFTAEVSEPMMWDGKVIIPVGSLVEGRVTWVRGGKRIGGAAAIHLEPRTVTLPDGAQYILRSRVIDTNRWDNTKVDDEGTIMRSENTKRNLGVMGLTTGGGAAAGAMIGGPAGALVGAGVGAGVTTVIWLKQDRQAVLPKDLGLVLSLTEPMSVTPVSASVPVKGLAPGAE